MTDVKKRESRLRSKARRYGLKIVKSRRTGGIMIVDGGNVAVAWTNAGAGMSLDEAEAYFAD